MAQEEETFARMEDWEPNEETQVKELRPDGGVNTTICTAIIAGETIMICPHCGGHNRLTNKKCVKCDYKLL